MICEHCEEPVEVVYGKLLHNRPDDLFANQRFCEGTNTLAVLDQHEPSDYDWPRDARLAFA